MKIATGHKGGQRDVHPRMLPWAGLLWCGSAVGSVTDVNTEGTSHSWIKCFTTNCGVVAVVFHPGLVSCPRARWLLWWCRSAAGSETDVITEGTSHSWIKCCTTKCGVVAARIPSGSVSCPRAKWLLENREPSPMWTAQARALSGERCTEWPLQPAASTGSMSAVWWRESRSW